MDKMAETLTNAEVEKYIKKSGLVYEIGAALRDYFIVDVRIKGDVLTLRFPNEQRFQLTITQV